MIKLLHIAFRAHAPDDRADALKRLADEYGAGFAEGVAADVEAHELIERNRVEGLRVARNARRRERRAHQ